MREDEFQNPELVQAQFQLGRNARFWADAATGEFEQAVDSGALSGGSIAASAAFINLTSGGGGTYGRGRCFPLWTRISVEGGEIEMSEIKRGLPVWAWDFTHNRPILAPISDIFDGTSDDFTTIVCADTDLMLVSAHQVYSNNEFKAAGEIKVGDICYKWGQSALVETKVLYTAPQKAVLRHLPVRTFTVPDYNNFFANRLLVHNLKQPEIGL